MISSLEFVDMLQKKTIHISEGKGSDTVKEFAEFLTEHGGNPEQVADLNLKSMEALHFSATLRESQP